MKFTINLGRPFLGHYYYILGLSDQCLGVEKKFFKKYSNFTLLPRNYFLLGWGVMTITITCLLTLQMLHTKLVKIGPAVFEKKMLTHDGRQLITIGHLSDLGDPKPKQMNKLYINK